MSRDIMNMTFKVITCTGFMKKNRTIICCLIHFQIPYPLIIILVQKPPIKFLSFPDIYPLNAPDI